MTRREQEWFALDDAARDHNGIARLGGDGKEMADAVDDTGVVIHRNHVKHQKEPDGFSRSDSPSDQYRAIVKRLGSAGV
jgi:hypothetical protein